MSKQELNGPPLAGPPPLRISTSAAERMRRHRERRKKGFCCVSLRKYCGRLIENNVESD
jgi:hypothetical protein